MPRQNNVFLLSDIAFDKPTTQGELRDFNGVANSGKPFSYFGEMTIVDLAELRFEDKKPTLHIHNRAERAGWGHLSVENHELLINGKLLTNKHGSEIAKDADEGFPWQMSAHIIADQIDELAHGQQEVVNGQTVTGPMVVLRQARVSEISFTPTGVDSQTSAVVLGDNGMPRLLSQDTKTNTPQDQSNGNGTADASPTSTAKQEDTDMTPEQMKEKIEALETKNADLETKNADLEKENAELKQAKTQSDVEAKLSAAGFDRTEDGKGFAGISDSTMNMLLSAETDAATAMIGDLALSRSTDDSQGNAATPSWLLGEQRPPEDGSAQGQKLSDNPMIANAQARGQSNPDYV